MDEKNVGVDALGQAVAGLAAAAAVFTDEQDLFNKYLTAAEALYRLAISTRGKEKSYCEFVPGG